MSNSTKISSEKDYQQTLQQSFNDNDKTISVSGFLSSKVGAKITRTAVSSTIEDYRYLDVVSTLDGTTANTSPIITDISSTTSLSIGQYVFGTGIPANSKILTIDSISQITLDSNATASATVSLKFANILYRLRITYDGAAHNNVDDSERLE